jgi:hypothetical protein
MLSPFSRSGGWAQDVCGLEYPLIAISIDISGLRLAAH